MSKFIANPSELRYLFHSKRAIWLARDESELPLPSPFPVFSWKCCALLEVAPIMRATPVSTSSFHFVAVSLNFAVAIFCLFAPSQPVLGQDAQASFPVRPLITQPVDEARLTVLRGNTHPLARPEFDLGTAPASLPMERMLLVLKRSPEQETALRKLLDDQQDKSSPNYHKWLTPEQFGRQFGPGDSDMQTITSWLQSHGFQVGSTRGRTVLEFSGSASQVQEAFHTTIHKYVVNGEQHWANAADPQIPTALAPAIAGIDSLNNFPRKPMSRVLGAFSGDKTTGQIQPLEPIYTLPTGCVENPTSTNPCFYGVSPYDFATIYNVLPLWNAGINGSGQTIAIVGETNINIQDVRDFRTLFGLPANDPQIILNGPDPGIRGDEVEANLDMQWSGAVAPNATIKFVASASTITTFGVDLSAVYIVENNIAPVVSESYGLCELALGTAGNQFYSSLWQQAAAQGITVFISAGDNGSAGCDDFNAQSPAPARFGLQVSGFASTPYNVAVGGTDFNDFLNPSTYWNTTNSTTQASAKGYIPELPWNATCTSPVFGQIGYSANAETNCNDSRIIPYFDVPVGGSGGASNCTTSDGLTTSSCTGGYAKPSWQSGVGVPNDGKRDIPDVSLFASSGFLGNFYMMCEADITPGPCSLAPNYYFLAVGGTSASSPAFAGIMALVNQQMALTTQNPNERQGNANYIFYKLAAQQPTAFHDVTTGTIEMPCVTGSPNCSTTSSGDAYGVLTGYNAGTGYDLASGLGSVDANKLVLKWNSVTLLPSTTTLSSLTPTTVTHGQAVNFTVSVAPKSGSGTPTGLISLQGGPTNTTADIQGFTLTQGAVSGTTEMLPGGSYSVTAHYPGDSTYGPSDSSPISVTVAKENSQPRASLVTFDNTGNIVNGNTNTAPYGSPYILRVNVANAGGQLCSPVASAATACPSGTVSLTNNGTTLDAGTYTLNTFGYAEDLIAQLPGGTDSVKASYSGDTSFNASIATNAISITPAPTSMPAPSGPTWTILAGQSTWFNVTVQSSSSGVAPTGSVTLYANGTALPAATSYSGSAGSGNQGASLGAFFQPTFTTSGTKTITASYSGDSNYGSSSSPSTSVSVLYPTTETISSSAQVVSSGTTVTLTALVDTTQKNIPPTGTFTFYSTNGVVNATPTITQVTDSSGNSALQATIMVTIISTIDFSFQYSGDGNYVSGSSNDIEIGVPDFYMSPGFGTVTMSAGQSQQLAVNISDEYGFNGTVTNFACAGLPAETTCAFSPASVTGSGATTMTITTTALGQSSVGALRESHRSWWPLWAMGALGICLVGVSPRNRHRSMLAFLICVSLVAFPSCGGSSNLGGGGGGGGGQPNPTPSITSLSPGAMAAGSAAQAISVNGTGFITNSSVTFNGVSHNASYMSATQLSVWLTDVDLSATGAFPVKVTNPAPGGGTSAAVNFNVETGTPTGNFPVTVTATGAGFTHTFSFTLSIQ